jgi:hypothetical protein
MGGVKRWDENMQDENPRDQKSQMPIRVLGNFLSFITFLSF